MVADGVRDSFCDSVNGSGDSVDPILITRNDEIQRSAAPQIQANLGFVFDEARTRRNRLVHVTLDSYTLDS